MNININRKNTIIAMLAISLLVYISGCLQDPNVSSHATMKHISVNYDLDIKIHNYYPVDLELSDIVIAIKRGPAANWEIIGTGKISGGFLPKDSEKHFYGTLEIGDNLIKAQKDKKLYVKYDTIATAKVYGASVWSQNKDDLIEIDNPINEKTIHVVMEN